MCSNVFVFYSADVFHDVGFLISNHKEKAQNILTFMCSNLLPAVLENGRIHWVGYTGLDTLGRKCANRRLQRMLMLHTEHFVIFILNMDEDDNDITMILVE